MVWTGLAANGTRPRVSIRDRFNSESYIHMLAKNLLPETPLITGGDYLFQQDDGNCHVSCASSA